MPWVPIKKFHKETITIISSETHTLREVVIFFIVSIFTAKIYLKEIIHFVIKPRQFTKKQFLGCFMPKVSAYLRNDRKKMITQKI